LALISLWDWRAANPHLFSSNEALRWHLRQHRNEYIRADALFMIAGRYTIDPSRFEVVLRAVGQRIAVGASVDSASADPAHPVLEPAR